MGGGGGNKKRSQSPVLGDAGRYWEARTYPLIERGLSGQGFLRDSMSVRDAYKKSFNESRPGFDSVMNRTVLRGDTKTRGFYEDQRSQTYNKTMQGLKETRQAERDSDRELAKSLGTDAISSAKRMGASITDIYNQQEASNLASTQAYGTYSSNLASGLGAAGGWMSAAQRYGKGFA